MGDKARFRPPPDMAPHPAERGGAKPTAASSSLRPSAPWLRSQAALPGCSPNRWTPSPPEWTASRNAPPAARDTAGAAAVTALSARVDALENAPAEPCSGAVNAGAVNAGAVTALAARVGALEGDRPAPTAAAFPHTWTRRGDTLPEEYLAVELPRGVWRLAFESACMGDMSSCPRPGDRVPTVYVRDIAEGPSASISGFRTGSEWCEDFELDRQVHWRLWVGGAGGVTWSLTAVRGQCPENR